jgi:hypothetical protein
LGHDSIPRISSFNSKHVAAAACGIQCISRHRESGATIAEVVTNLRLRVTCNNILHTMSRLACCLLLVLFPYSLFAAGHDLTTAPPTTNQTSPVLAGSGSGFVAAWIERPVSGNTIVSRAVRSDGEPVENSGGAIDQRYVYSMAIAHSPSEALLVWIVGGDVYAERLSPSGAPLDAIALTPGKDYASDIAVAWNGSRYFVVWSNGYQLVGTLVAPDGSSTPPRAFFGEPNVIGKPASPYILVPDVAWDGRNFIVVFGEAPNYPCVLSVCPSPSADHFLVMRVNAAGDAIDPSPAVIKGAHFRAHVASSGAESLIALDSPGQVSTIVAHTESGLTLDAEMPLFQWYSSAPSAVAWDGAAYNVGWTYMSGYSGPGWLGAARVTRFGVPFDYRFAGTAATGPPSIAVNDAGTTAFAVSEATSPKSLTRARLYLASEFAPIPAPPPAPANVVSYFSGITARIDWQQSETPAGFALEWSWDFGKSWGFYTFIPADARTITVNAHVGNLFRVRAIGPGGVSEGTITSIGSMQRRRAERP